MNKLISASLIAILTVGVANATPEYAAAVPVEPLSVTANTKVASTSYVQGAYNEAIKAVNKENQRALAAEGDLSTLTTSTKTSLVGAINEIAGTAGSALTAAQITEGTTDGAISVAGTPVSVHGLGSAAYTASTAYDAAGAAATAEQNAKDYADGLASDYATAAQGAKADTALQSGANVSVLTNDAGYITSSALSGYATETYVGTAISNAASNYDAAGAAATAEQNAKDYADAKYLDVYTTWNTDTHLPVNLSNPVVP